MNWCGRREPVEPERIAVAFTRVLRGAGIDVTVGATLTFARALECVGLAERREVYWAARATLVTRPEQIVTFDRAFTVFWDRVGSGAAGDDAVPEEQSVVLALDV